MEQQRGNTCDVCGCVYHWEMFFHNHLRDVHSIPTKKSKRTSLGKTNKAFLQTYYRDISKRPTLEEIENVANFLDIKKENVYWWFVNRNKQNRKAHKAKLSSKRHVDRKGRIDRVSPGALERGKRSKKERNWRKCWLNQRPNVQIRQIGKGYHFWPSHTTFAPLCG